MDSCGNWWQAVERIAQHVGQGTALCEVFEEFVSHDLKTAGYSSESIEKALDWYEKAALSGNLSSVLGSLQPMEEKNRVANPIEKLNISEDIWNSIEMFKARGVISAELSERLLEGVRYIDTRDWDEDEVSTFIHDIVSASMPEIGEDFIESHINKLPQKFYC